MLTRRVCPPHKIIVLFLENGNVRFKLPGNAGSGDGRAVVSDAVKGCVGHSHFGKPTTSCNCLTASAGIWSRQKPSHIKIRSYRSTTSRQSLSFSGNSSNG